MVVGLNNQRVAKYNQALVLQELFTYEKLSISELSELTSLSIPAISRILDELLALHEVVEVPCENLRRGRGAGVFSLCNINELILCINITSTKIESLVTNKIGKVLSHKKVKEIKLVSKNDLMHDIYEVIDSYINEFKKNFVLAIALHGKVNIKSGVSLMMPQAPWHDDLHIKFLIEQKYNFEVRIDNDCVMRALAQKWSILRSKKEIFDLCILNLDYGVGSSFLINNEIYRGPLFGSGQIGHTIVEPYGEICSCGRQGCLETVASVGAIVKRVNSWWKLKHPTLDNLSFDDIVTLYKNNDPTVKMQIEMIALTIGRSIYNFLNIININHIYIYGKVCKFGDEFLHTIRLPISSNPFEGEMISRELQTTIEYGTLSEDEQLAGIAFIYDKNLMSGFDNY